MPTVTEIHNIAPIAQYLASNDISNGALYGHGSNPNIAVQIYLMRKPVEWLFALENIAGGAIPSATLTQTSNWLFSWLGQYGLQASYLINNGGVIVNPSPPPTIYGLPITATYTAAVDGEYILPIALATGAKVIFAQKGSALPLNSLQYFYISPNLTLLGGITMSAFEDLTYQYVLPI